MDAITECNKPPIYYDQDTEEAPTLSNLFDEQVGQGYSVEGSVMLGDTAVQVDGMGEGHHSLGIRD